MAVLAAVVRGMAAPEETANPSLIWRVGRDGAIDGGGGARWWWRRRPDPLDGGCPAVVGFAAAASAASAREAREAAIGGEAHYADAIEAVAREARRPR